MEGSGLDPSEACNNGSGLKWDTGTQGHCFDFASGATNKSYHITISRTWFSWNSLPATPQSPTSTGDIYMDKILPFMLKSLLKFADRLLPNDLILG